MIQRRENRSGLNAEEVQRLENALLESRRVRRETIEKLGLSKTDDDLRLDALAAREFAALARVNEALQRLDAGDYGLCAGCGRPIGFERLALQPAAPFCADCEEAAEAA